MSERGRTEFRDGREPMLVPGLRHVGWSQFVDAKRDALRAHAHDGAYEVCYIVRGSLSWWIDERSYAVGPGQLFMTLPDEVHGAEHGVMDPCELYWVSFDLSAAGGLDLEPAEAAAIDRALRAAPHRTCAGPASLPQLYDRILGALAAPDELSAARIRGAMALLLTEVAAAYAGAGDDAPAACSERIARARDWLQTHATEAISVDQAAAVVELRPSQFRSRFKHETGFAPQEYLVQLRLAEAKCLLETTRLSVTEVALRSGFNSSAWFSTAFRKHTGFSPREWRQREPS